MINAVDIKDSVSTPKFCRFQSKIFPQTIKTETHAVINAENQDE